MNGDWTILTGENARKEFEKCYRPTVAQALFRYPGLDDFFQFTCLRCGRCCSGLVQALVFPRETKPASATCMHLGKEQTCLIQESKPAQCRLAPMAILPNRKAKMVAVAVEHKRATNCPGLKHSWQRWRVRDWLETNGLDEALKGIDELARRTQAVDR